MFCFVMFLFCLLVVVLTGFYLSFGPFDVGFVLLRLACVYDKGSVVVVFLWRLACACSLKKKKIVFCLFRCFVEVSLYSCQVFF